MMRRSVRMIVGLAAVSAMATIASAQQFYLGTGASNPTTLNSLLYSGSGAPSTPTLIGSMGIPAAYGSPTWDSFNATMYFVNGAVSNTSSIYTLNLTTGAATFLTGTTAPGICQLAYDSLNGKFYGFDGVNIAGGPKMGLYQISTNGGTSSLLNNNTTGISALTYNPVLNLLFAGVANGGLYTIDPDTYAITEVATTSGAKDTCWFTYDPASGNYFGADNARNFFEINSSTYAVTTLSTSVMSTRPNGLAEIIAAPEPGTLGLAATGLLTVAGLAGWRRKK